MYIIFLCAERIHIRVDMPMCVYMGAQMRERQEEKPCFLTCRALFEDRLKLKVNSSFHVGSFVLPSINLT